MTTEFSRVYYHGGQYSCGAAGPRVGYSQVVSCDLDESGAVVGFSTGQRVHLPRDWYNLSWTP